MEVGGDNMTFDPMAGVNQINDKFLKQQQNMLDHISENFRRKAEREVRMHELAEEQVELLKEIKDAFPEMLGLIRKNNEINKELFDLFQELNTIMVAQNEEEAQGILEKVVGKAALLNDGADAIKSLYEHGQMLVAFIKQQYLG